MIIQFSDDEINVLNKMSEVFSIPIPEIGTEWTDQSVFDIWDAAIDYEVHYGFDQNNTLTAEGRVASDIADKLLAA